MSLNTQMTLILLLELVVFPVIFFSLGLVLVVITRSIVKIWKRNLTFFPASKWPYWVIAGVSLILALLTACVFIINFVQHQPS